MAAAMYAWLGLSPCTGPAQAAMSPSQAEEPKDDEKAGSKSQDPKAGKKGESDDKDKKGKGGAGAKGQKKDPRSQVDPELKKRIDKLIEEKSARQAEQARQRAARREDGKQQSGQQPTRQRRQPTKRPTQTPAGSPPSTGPGGTKAPAGKEASPSTPVDIPPTETDVPPEERKYVFSIKDGTYEQLLDAFARMTGLGVVGEAPKDGKVTFVSSEELTFDEALARVQVLLFKYKPHDPYWLFRRETHLEVMRVTDIYRVLPLERMYKSVEDFRAANLRDDELALLIYTVKSGTPADLTPVRDFMPDYVRVAPLPGASRITIFALVKHINKYLDLIPIIAQQQGDPRTLEKIELKHILPSEAVSKLEQLMDLGGGQPQRRSTRSPRGKDISPLDTMGQPEVTLVPEDAQGVLLVKAMQDKIEEIKQLLPYIDVDTFEGVEPVVIPVEHGDPEQLIGTVQQILAASSGSPQSGVTKRPSSRRKTGGKVTSGPLKAGSITLLTHPSRNAIIVIADEEDTAWVRELVKKFDVPGAQVGPLRITLAYAEPEELATTVKSLLGVAAKGKTGAERLQVMPEPGGKAVWFKGSEKELEQVRELIATLDVAEDAASLHVVTLRRQSASWVADMVQQFDQRSAGPSPAAKPRGKRDRKPSASKFTPDDEHNRLFILCTDKEWAVYERVIEQLEAVGEGDPLFIRVPVEHLDPGKAIDRLTWMMLPGGGKTLTMNLTPTDGAILVRNATESRLEEIRTLLEEIDQPIEIVERKFEIRHRDPAEIIAAIEALIGGSADAKSPRRRPRPKDAKGGGVALGAVSMGTAREDLTIVPFGNSLIIRTTPEKMEQVAELIAELDVEEAQTELKIYDDFPPGTDVSGIADVLSSVFSPSRATVPRRKGGASPAGGEGPQFIPQPGLGKLIVIAEPTMFAEIEDLMASLHSAPGLTAKEVTFFDVEFGDPQAIIEQITPLLDLHINELIAAGELSGSIRPVAVSSGKPAKRRPGPLSDASEHYHIAADARDNRIVFAAAPVLVERARELVKQFDTSQDGEEPVFRTVLLEQASSTEMVKVIRDMMDLPRLPSGGRPQARGKPGAAVPAKAKRLTVVEAPGGGAVVLIGLLEDVEQATEWIEKLDAMPTRGRAIKIYSIEHADIERLVDLIVVIVDKPAVRPTGGKPVRARRGVQAVEEEEVFETTKKWVGQDLYIQADLIASTMLVATTEAKMAEIDGLVTQFNAPPDAGEPTSPLHEDAPLPRFMYDLAYKEAFDAEFEAEMIFEQLWDSPDELPQVEAALFGNSLIVKYPYKERFPEIKEIIRKYVDVRGIDWGKRDTKVITAPTEIGSAKAFALWLQMNHPELDVKVVDKTRQDEDVDIERLRPRQREAANPCVLPTAFGRMVSGVLTAAPGQTEPEDESQGEEGASKPLGPQDTAGDPQEGLLEEAVKRLLDESAAPETPGSSGAGEVAPTQNEDIPELTIEVDDRTNAVVIHGPAGVLKEIPDWVEELKDELKDAPAPPDIRVFRVQYIDVFSAAEILEEMFNATRQQRATVQAAQRRQQQLARQQQQRQQRQQQQQQQQGKQPGQQQQRPGQRDQQQAQRGAVPQLPEPAVRIYPNPRDRTLILRAEPNQYPVLKELLATIDQPKPIDSEMRIFKLKKLNAAEVEEALVELLGLDERPSPRRTPSRTTRRQPAGAATRGSTGGQLPRTIMQETVSGTNLLGVDAQDIKMSANEASNTIVAMAPKAALDFIGELIQKLESEEIPERLTQHYELAHANADDVAEYLAVHFDEGRSPGGSRKGKGARGGGDAGLAPRTLTSPSFIPYPRLNLLSVLATEEQFKEIDNLVARVDVSSEQEDWEDVTLLHADAKVVAETLSEMFDGSTGSRGKGGRSDTSAMAARFIGAEGGRLLLINAPVGLRDQILAAVEKLEADAKDATSVRVVTLLYATPTKVAEAIEATYGIGRRSRTGGPPTGSRFSITPYDSAKQLFIQADDETFAEIESLITTIDKATDLPFEFRIYRLKYASAAQVHATMTNLITDYLRQLGPRVEREAFSVEVDEKANALIVLGSATVFGFLEENLPKIDTPVNAVSPTGFLMVALKSATAEEVAASIGRIYSSQKLPEGQDPVQAEANRALNTVIVHGPQDQLDEIKKEIIDPLEEQATPTLLTETIDLQFADAEAVADSINRIYEAKRRAYELVVGRGDKRAALEFTVVLTPQVSTKQVVIQASEKNMPLVKAHIAQFDREDVAAKLATTIKMYPVKHADPDALVRIITEWSRARPHAGGGRDQARTGDVVNATAEPVTQSVVVTASAVNHLIIQELIADIDSAGKIGQEVHVLDLTNADADSVTRTLTEIFVRSSPRSSGGAPPITISALQGSKAVVVKCSPEDFAEIEAVVAELDTEEVMLGEKVSVIILLYADATEVETSLREYLQKPGGGGRGSELAGDMRLSVLSQSNAIVVSGDGEGVARIEALAQQLDSAGEVGSVPQIIKLEHARAGQLGPLLEEMFAEQRGGGRRDQAPPVIRANDATNELIVRAGPTDFAAIESIVKKLDPPGAALQKNFVLVQMSSGMDVEDLAFKVEEAINEGANKQAGSRRGGDVPSIRITPDKRTMSLIVSGSPELFAEAEEMAHALEKLGPAGGQATVMIRLSNTPAEEFERLIELLKGEESSSGGRSRRSSPSRSGGSRRGGK